MSIFGLDANAPMSPREYVETIVLPTLRDALTDRADKRRAYLACLVVCHCADFLGLAQAMSQPGFATMSNRKRKCVSDAATKAVQEEVFDRCGSVFTIVQGFANGTKHPARRPLLPGTEETVQPFAFDTPGAGLDEGRWDVPGLAVEDDEEVLFLDACLQHVLAAFVCAYPAHLGDIALGSFMDPCLPVLGLDLPPAWIGAVTAWAAGRSEVAEVWLFGSRAKRTSRPNSDLGIGIVLVPSAPGHDWPLGNWLALHGAWQDELEANIGRHVSLVAFSRPGENMDEREAEARAPAVKLWSRPDLWPDRATGLLSPCQRALAAACADGLIED